MLSDFLPQVLFVLVSVPCFLVLLSQVRHVSRHSHSVLVLLQIPSFFFFFHALPISVSGSSAVLIFLLSYCTPVFLTDLILVYVFY